jgi:hypothetical protein
MLAGFFIYFRSCNLIALINASFQRLIGSNTLKSLSLNGFLERPESLIKTCCFFYYDLTIRNRMKKYKLARMQCNCIWFVKNC